MQCNKGVNSMVNKIKLFLSYILGFFTVGTFYSLYLAYYDFLTGGDLVLGAMVSLLMGAVLTAFLSPVMLITFLVQLALEESATKIGRKSKIGITAIISAILMIIIPPVSTLIFDDNEVYDKTLIALIIMDFIGILIANIVYKSLCRL